MNTIESMYVRRSIRKYKDAPVEKKKLIELLKVAMAGPSACNSQPWDYVVVTDKSTLFKMRMDLECGRYKAPAAIVVCGNMKDALDGERKGFWVQDCSSAISNMLNAAVGMGLGTVWIGVYPREENCRIVSKILDLPKDVIPLAIIYVGYPDECKEPRTQYNEKRVFWQKYCNDKC